MDASQESQSNDILPAERMSRHYSASWNLSKVCRMNTQQIIGLSSYNTAESKEITAISGALASHLFM